MRARVPLVAGALVCLVMPLPAQQSQDTPSFLTPSRPRVQVGVTQQANYVHTLKVDSNAPVDRSRSIIP